MRQLLAFGRKQILQYQTVDLKEVVGGFERLLRGTIREDIEIEIIPSATATSIRADIGQLEQVIMNLAVNAQDAMPEGGKLILETGLMELDADYAAAHQEVAPGEYVMLAVSDTGCGMDAEVREHIFEPFFTTKGELGTGLGLATSDGIIKQHGGSIWVYSEPGRGTTFKIYLPVVEAKGVERKAAAQAPAAQRGSETVLLVEDDEGVRDLTCAFLERQGYTVLLAENGMEALSLLEEHGGAVALILTDVVMPGISGDELGQRARESYPELKVLYMSGYTNDVINHHGVLDEHVSFIQKPYSIQALAAKVREVLDKDSPGI